MSTESPDKTQGTEIITAYLEEDNLETIDGLVEEEIYDSRTEFIVEALADFDLQKPDLELLLDAAEDARDRLFSDTYDSGEKQVYSLGSHIAKLEMYQRLEGDYEGTGHPI